MTCRFSPTLESNCQKGFTVVELLVSMLLATVVVAGAIKHYLISAQQARDNQIRVETFLQAQAVVQNIGFELRTVGNGVPFDQANFQIGESSLSDPTVTEPINVAATTASSITFRVNETGTVALLTQDFDPSIDLEVVLTDVSSLTANDPIYISNSVVAGDDGFYGIIDSVDTGNSSATIAAGYVSTPGATFDKGSVFEEVASVVYTSDTLNEQITRNSGFGDIIVAKNAALAFDYLDSSGTSLTLPMAASDLTNSLRAITVTVTVESSKILSNTKETYTATATQTFGLRNLTYLY